MSAVVCLFNQGTKFKMCQLVSSSGNGKNWKCWGTVTVTGDAAAI
jgi:hypothetical protein